MKLERDVIFLVEEYIYDSEETVLWTSTYLDLPDNKSE